MANLRWHGGHSHREIGDGLRFQCSRGHQVALAALVAKKPKKGGEGVNTHLLCVFVLSSSQSSVRVPNPHAWCTDRGDRLDCPSEKQCRIAYKNAKRGDAYTTYTEESRSHCVQCDRYELLAQPYVMLRSLRRVFVMTTLQQDMKEVDPGVRQARNSREICKRLVGCFAEVVREDDRDLLRQCTDVAITVDGRKGSAVHWLACTMFVPGRPCSQIDKRSLILTLTPELAHRDRLLGGQGAAYDGSWSPRRRH